MMRSCWNGVNTSKQVFKILAITVTIGISCLYSASAQLNIENKSKIYDAWISLDNQSQNVKGLLYEIKDSSIIVSNSTLKKDYLSGNFNLSSIDFYSIDHVSIRRKNKVIAGTIIGSALGLAGAIGIGHIAGGEGGLIAVLYGPPALLFGAGIGALAGSFRIKIPIGGSFENFKSNERRLERYSYLIEYSNGLNSYEKAYEHKWFIGVIVGVSFPSGDFEHSPQVNLNEEFSKAGGNSNLILGYSYKQNFGISASFLNSSYNFKNSSADTWWSLSTILTGPMYSVPLRRNLNLDLKPMIGSTSSSLNIDDVSYITGNGFSIYPCISLRYNFSMRWCALIESGYLYTTQKFEDGNKKMQATNLGAGIAYRFR
jgi:hypothetical protein